MKIASYNVMSGGFNSCASTTDRPERLSLLQKAIKEIKADFIGLIDTFRWVEVFNTEDLKNLFSYKEVFSINMDDTRVDKRIGITVLTNLPVKKFQSIRLATRNCLKAEINFKNKVLDIFTVYLDDLKEETRFQQIKALLNQVSTNSTIIMGDLNTFRPEEIKQAESKIDSFLKINPDFTKREDYQSYFVPAFEGMCQAKVIPLIRSAGFAEIEVSDQISATFPTPLFYNAPSPICRIDHLFCTKDLTISNFKVLTGGVFNIASDHYPIVAEVSFK